MRSAPVRSSSPQSQVKQRRERLVTSNLTSLIDDPGGHLVDHYDWRPNVEVNHGGLIADLVELLSALGFPALSEPIAPEFGPDAPDGFYAVGHQSLATARELAVPIVQIVDDGSGAVNELGLRLVPVPSSHEADQPIDTLYLTALVDPSLPSSATLDDTWTFEARSGFADPGAVDALSPGSADFDDAVAGSDAGLTLAAEPGEAWRLLGGDTGPRLLLHGVELDLDLRRGPPVELTISARTSGSGLELVVDPGDGDGFVSALLSNVDLSVPFGLGLSWSSVDGFVLDAATGLAVEVPLGLRIGPIELTTLHLLTLVGTDGFSFAAGITASAELGPIVCSVANIGMLLELAPPDTGGALQASLAFKPPEGIGIGVDLDVVSGGGYLYIDVEAGSYDGVLDLEVLGVGISRGGDHRHQAARRRRLVDVLRPVPRPALDPARVRVHPRPASAAWPGSTGRSTSTRSDRQCARVRSTRSCSRRTRSPTRR